MNLFRLTKKSGVRKAASSSTRAKIGGLLITLTLAGCETIGFQDPINDTGVNIDQPDPDEVDNDGDGYSENDGDCDDGDADVNPGATEACNDRDDNCNGTVDENALGTWYADLDQDGYGDSADAIDDCVAPSHYVADDSDCDDGDADVNPGATEACNDRDDNCNGTVDEGVTSTFYADLDGDGQGDLNAPVEACSQPDGYVTDSRDCYDLDAEIFVGQSESCNGVDDDCDAIVDEDDAVDAIDFFGDVDGDGYGDVDNALTSCTIPAGYVVDATDCDDTDASVNPGELETCNEVDDNCDGTVDEDEAIDASTWYADADGDGFGNEDAIDYACNQPSGYVADANDCDDDDAAISPADSEICDTIDNDCDGDVDEDEAIDASTWYADLDRDSYGDAGNTHAACSLPTGYVENDDDCDDLDSSVSPAEAESCNEVDDDCDGDVDEDEAIDASTWYADADGDGYGDASVMDIECDAPTGYVDDWSDCDDSDPGDMVDADGDGYTECDGDCADLDRSTHPGATEYVNGADDDCDGVVDNNTDSYDDDGDGWTEDDGDCDDSVFRTNPDAPQDCEDGVDRDCDGTVDEDASDWYPDGDGDGFGDETATATAACDQPSGYVADATDCDDNQRTTYPGAEEIENGLDDDCDGNVDQGTDASDEDGDGYSENDGDCDDGNVDVSPAATETCNGLDDDCDGDVDENDAIDAGTWYADADDDEYGDDSVTQIACDAPSGYVAIGGDCDDGDALYNPGADESDCTDPTDYNCDGSVMYDDADLDGFAACEDCDDGDDDSYPGADEFCNGQDDDCDGEVDEDDAIDDSDWYPDGDGDGFGDETATATAACDQPSGYVADATDCDDNQRTSYPGAEEYCNTLDDDCDGDVDEEVCETSDTGDSGGDTGTCEDDEDGDGLVSEACGGDDCEDSLALSNPDAAETCDDGVDNDCDGVVDEATCLFTVDGVASGGFLVLTLSGGLDDPSSLIDCTSAMTLTSGDQIGVIDYSAGGAMQYLPYTGTGSYSFTITDGVFSLFVIDGSTGTTPQCWLNAVFSANTRDVEIFESSATTYAWQGI